MELAVKGMAETLWCMAWADVAEHAYKDGKPYPMGGIRIEDHAKPAPEHAYRLAERLRGAIEQANGCPLWELYLRALERDGKACNFDRNFDSAEAERFGVCLAHMAIRSGVSWFDDHRRFQLEVPQIIEHCYQTELFSLAVQTLAKDGYVWSEESAGES